ncbi:unnamed protein product [Orchesella dallaii]|uniref:Cytochrome b5 heme-binding domain-containing protein n=1 Tax=Orchesella dallaii TaxID=48710 RepID=A0ABP1Q407_9HEXA
MSPSPKDLDDGLCTVPSLESLEPMEAPDGNFDESLILRKRMTSETSAYESESVEKRGGKKLEILYEGYFYDVTEFIKRHPGGNIIELYQNGEDATIAIQQFHYRSLKMVLARMKGLPKRPATTEEIGLPPETKARHDELTKDFQALTAEIESEGLMDANPRRFLIRILHSLVMFSCGLAISYWLGGSSIIWRALSVFLMTLAGGQYLWLGHEGGHNSFTGNPKIDRGVQIFSFGFVFGLSASSWNSTHSEHHAMPQHETKDSDLKTMPLIAFSKRVVRDPKQASKFWLHYQHLFFIFCDTLIVTLTWKLNHHLKFVIKNKCWFDLFCMMCHYSLVPILGFVDWMLITWLGSIYVLGNLILSHTHLPVVEEGQKLHWVEYAFHHTTNIRSSWWVDWWTGHLNYQIEHHLFPTMPEYKNKLCRDKVKAFAKKHGLPYKLCSYWEAVKSTYFNLEHVANELRNL